MRSVLARKKGLHCLEDVKCDLSGYSGTEFNVIRTEVAVEATRPGRCGDTVVVEEMLVPFTGGLGSSFGYVHHI